MKQSILFHAQVILNIKGDHAYSIRRAKASSAGYGKLWLGLLLALVASLLAAAACSSSSNPTKMTAKEYYRYLLVENGYTDEDLKPNVEEIKKMIEKRKWLGASNTEP